MSDDLKKERSRLLNKQKEERTGIEKQLKKAKGAMKEKFEKELEQLEAKHAEEMQALEAGATGTSSNSASTSSDQSSSKKGKEKAFKIFKDAQWDAYSKTELAEACQERGLGKKGGKEELIMKLISFHQEQRKKLEANPELAKIAEEEANKKGGRDEEKVNLYIIPVLCIIP